MTQNLEKDISNQTIHEGLHGNKQLYSWVSPSGSIIPVPNRHTHVSYGIKILKKLKIKPIKQTYAQLFKLGWCRVTYYLGSVYLNNSISKPTPKQIKEIKDEALMAGMKSVIWDNETDEIVLWSKTMNEKIEKKAKYLVKGVKVHGKEYNIYTHSHGIKDAFQRVTFHIIKDLNLNTKADFGKIYTYILQNYYRGWVTIEQVPEQGNLFDNETPSFKSMYNKEE
jgi:hypothetical protein